MEAGRTSENVLTAQLHISGERNDISVGAFPLEIRKLTNCRAPFSRPSDPRTLETQNNIKFGLKREADCSLQLLLHVDTETVRNLGFPQKPHRIAH
jgi:hypothetical protein